MEKCGIAIQNTRSTDRNFLFPDLRFRKLKKIGE